MYPRITAEPPPRHGLEKCGTCHIMHCAACGCPPWRRPA
jgi:hypothetical protein